VNDEQVGVGMFGDLLREAQRGAGAGRPVVRH
jgi:hypothetical protein